MKSPTDEPSGRTTFARNSDSNSLIPASTASSFALMTNVSARQRCRHVRSARRDVVRILDGWPSADALLDAYTRIALIT